MQMLKVEDNIGAFKMNRLMGKTFVIITALILYLALGIPGRAAVEDGLEVVHCFDDLIDGILLCGNKAEAIGNVYILTGEEAVTLNQLVQTIATTLGVRPNKLRLPVTPVYLAGFLCELLCKPFGVNPPLYRRRVDFFRKTRCFDISKAKRDLGFQPRIDLQTGTRLTAEWYRKEGLL